jgi:outer membrane protein, multidrug efflux system
MKRNVYRSFLSWSMLLSAVIGLIGITSCTSLKTTEPAKELQLPENFGKASDTLTSATFDVNTFFFDENLRNIINIALQNNYDALIAIQRIEMAQSQVTGFRGALLPSLSINGALGQRRFGEYTMDGVGNYDTQFSPNITAEQIIPEHLPDFYTGALMSWEVDVWGKLRNKKLAAVERYLGSVEGRKWALTLLIEEIAVTYYELISYDLELEIENQTIELRKSELEVVIAQKEAGRTDELVVKQFEAQLYNTQSLAMVTQQRIVELENKLNLLMGRFPQPVNRTRNSFDLILPSQKFSIIPTELLSNRMDIKQAEHEVLATKADLKAAKMAFYPSLTINFGLGLQSFNSQFFLTPASLAYQALGGLSAPLLNRAAIKADFQYANAAQLEAVYAYQKSLLTGYVEVYNQLAAINNYNQAYALKSKEVDVLNYSLDTSFELFVNGRVNYLEIIYLRRSELIAKLELINIRKQQYMSIVGLYKAIGGGGF